MPFLYVFVVPFLAVVFERFVLLTLDPVGVEFEPPSGPPTLKNLDFATGTLLIYDKSTFSLYRCF